MTKPWKGDRSLQAMFKSLRKDQPGFANGMSRVIDSANAVTGHPAWDHARSIDWPGLAEANLDWFNSLLTEHPWPREAEAIWFEIPDDLNPAASLVQAIGKLGPADSDFGLDEGAIWPQADEMQDLVPGFAALPPLEEAIAAAGFRDQPEKREDLAPGVAIMAAGCVCLLAMETLERANILERVQHRSGLAVLSGYASGGVIPIGQLRQNGWGEVRRVNPLRGRAYWDERAFWPGLNFKRYLAGGGDPNLRDEYRPWRPTLLMSHAWSLKPRDVDLLVQAGAEVRARDEQGRCVLHYCGGTDASTVARLIEHGADANAISHHGESVLLKVAWRSVDVVRVLLNAGADPNPAPAGKHRMTPLDVASQYVLDPEIIRVLVDAGARWDWAVRDGSTPLHKLAEANALDQEARSRLGPLIDLYQSLGFDINQQNTEGMTPLWVALCKHINELSDHLQRLEEHEDLGGRWDYEHDLTAVRLLERGADPNTPMPRDVPPWIVKGSTPLMLPRYDDTRLVTALLKHGADPSATDANGRTALDHAKAAPRRATKHGTEGRAEVVALLEKAMRSKSPPTKHQS